MNDFELKINTKKKNRNNRKKKLNKLIILIDKFDRVVRLNVRTKVIFSTTKTTTTNEKNYIFQTMSTIRRSMNCNQTTNSILYSKRDY